MFCDNKLSNLKAFFYECQTEYTLCPRSSDPIYIVSYYMKLVTILLGHTAETVSYRKTGSECDISRKTTAEYLLVKNC